MAYVVESKTRMGEPIGICDKHELPLDDKGDCELCRLSDMPSRAPKAGSPVHGS